MEKLLKQRDNLKNIEELTIKLNTALQNIDKQTQKNLEKHNLQVSGLSMALLRVQIGIDKTLSDINIKTKEKKIVITKIS